MSEFPLFTGLFASFSVVGRAPEGAHANKVVKMRTILTAAGRREDYHEFSDIVKPLLKKQELQRLADFKHHRNKSRLDHSLDVAWLSYVIAKNLSCNHVSAARGCLLHDLFHYDWLTEGPRLHGFRHPRISLNNAEKIANLNERERDSIEKHMWPLTIVPPRYPESWSVCLADTYCAMRDYLDAVRNFRRALLGKGFKGVDGLLKEAGRKENLIRRTTSAVREAMTHMGLPTKMDLDKMTRTLARVERKLSSGDEKKNG